MLPVILGLWIAGYRWFFRLLSESCYVTVPCESIRQRDILGEQLSHCAD